MLPPLRKPVIVFDAGIGSFDIARRIHKRYPKQDVIYLADRQSFPYGAKSHKELYDAISDVFDFSQEKYNISSAVLASNTPSIMVLDNLQKKYKDLPIFGIIPPVDEALEQSQSGEIGIMGTKGMMESSEMQDYISKYRGANIHLINASPMIDTLVETGVFVKDKDTTERKIKDFLDPIFDKSPDLDTLTLSSTHLPWLNMAEPYPYLSSIYPEKGFIDPAEKTVEALGETLTHEGKGVLLSIATEREGLSSKELENIFATMGTPLTIETVDFRTPKNPERGFVR